MYLKEGTCVYLKEGTSVAPTAVSASSYEEEDTCVYSSSYDMHVSSSSYDMHEMDRKTSSEREQKHLARENCFKSLRRFHFAL